MLILAPTREIAVQIRNVILTIGNSLLPKLSVEFFIGGTNLADDKEKLKTCHIVVGTPGMNMSSNNLNLNFWNF